jgi:dCTP deaminase
MRTLPGGARRGSPHACDTDGAASLDLHISDRAFHLARGSCKPSLAYSYSKLLKDADIAERIETDSSGYFLLQRGYVYVFLLRERVPALKGTPICGRATAKSSVGRLDILARLIADRGSGYERFAGPEIGNGNLYLEVTSNTVSVRIPPGHAQSSPLPVSGMDVFAGE